MPPPQILGRVIAGAHPEYLEPKEAQSPVVVQIAAQPVAPTPPAVTPVGRGSSQALARASAGSSVTSLSGNAYTILPPGSPLRECHRPCGRIGS